jgi:hypothetical protein
VLSYDPLEMAPAEILRLARAGDLEALGKDRDSVAAAVLAFANAGDPESSLELFGRAWGIWMTRGELDQGRDVAAVALATMGSTDPTIWRARVLYADGLFAFRAGDGERSRRRNEEALQVALETGDGRGECDALTGLARLALRAGRHDEVIALARQGRERAKAIGSREAEASPLHLEAAGVRLLRDYTTARELYLLSLELSQELGHAASVTMELDCLGWVELHLGNVDEAEMRFRDRDARLGDDDAYARAWSTLTWSAVAAVRGDRDQAGRLYAEAAKALKELTNELDPDDQAEFDWLSEQLPALR